MRHYTPRSIEMIGFASQYVELAIEHDEIIFFDFNIPIPPLDQKPKCRNFPAKEVFNKCNKHQVKLKVIFMLYLLLLLFF